MANRIIQQENNGIKEVVVTDYGIGLFENVIDGDNQSMGYTIIETLCNQLDADIEISNGTGTTVTIRFKKENIKGSTISLV